MPARIGSGAANVPREMQGWVTWLSRLAFRAGLTLLLCACGSADRPQANAQASQPERVDAQIRAIVALGTSAEIHLQGATRGARVFLELVKSTESGGTQAFEVESVSDDEGRVALTGLSPSTSYQVRAQIERTASAGNSEPSRPSFVTAKADPVLRTGVVLLLDSDLGLRAQVAVDSRLLLVGTSGTFRPPTVGSYLGGLLPDGSPYLWRVDSIAESAAGVTVSGERTTIIRMLQSGSVRIRVPAQSDGLTSLSASGEPSPRASTTKSKLTASADASPPVKCGEVRNATIDVDWRLPDLEVDLGFDDDGEFALSASLVGEISAEPKLNLLDPTKSGDTILCSVTVLSGPTLPIPTRLFRLPFTVGLKPVIDATAKLRMSADDGGAIAVSGGRFGGYVSVFGKLSAAGATGRGDATAFRVIQGPAISAFGSDVATISLAGVLLPGHALGMNGSLVASIGANILVDGIEIARLALETGPSISVQFVESADLFKIPALTTRFPIVATEASISVRSEFVLKPIFNPLLERLFPLDSIARGFVFPAFGTKQIVGLPYLGISTTVVDSSTTFARPFAWREPPESVAAGESPEEVSLASDRITWFYGEELGDARLSMTVEDADSMGLSKLFRAGIPQRCFEAAFVYMSGDVPVVPRRPSKPFGSFDFLVAEPASVAWASSGSGAFARGAHSLDHRSLVVTRSDGAEILVGFTVSDAVVSDGRPKPFLSRLLVDAAEGTCRFSVSKVGIGTGARPWFQPPPGFPPRIDGPAQVTATGFRKVGGEDGSVSFLPVVERTLFIPHEYLRNQQHDLGVEFLDLDRLELAFANFPPPAYDSTLGTNWIRPWLLDRLSIGP